MRGKEFLECGRMLLSGPWRGESRIVLFGQNFPKTVWKRRKLDRGHPEFYYVDPALPWTLTTHSSLRSHDSALAAWVTFSLRSCTPRALDETLDPHLCRVLNRETLDPPLVVIHPQVFLINISLYVFTHYPILSLCWTMNHHPSSENKK